MVLTENAPGYFEPWLWRAARTDHRARRTGGSAVLVNERFAEVFGGADPMNGQVAVSLANQPPPAQPQWLTVLACPDNPMSLHARRSYLPIAGIGAGHVIFDGSASR